MENKTYTKIIQLKTHKIYIMKKHFLAVALFLVSALAVNSSHAQQSEKKHKEHANVLNLTADQQSKLKAIKKDQKAQSKAIRADSSLSQEQKKQKMKELHGSFSQKKNAILTPDQIAKQDSLRAMHKHYGKGRKKDKVAALPQSN